MSINSELRTLLEKRDKRRCLYCLTTEDNCGLRMHVDHIIPVSVGGNTIPENLCLACFSCNVYKSAKQVWKDPLTQEIVTLFHPLKQNWIEHFTWDETKTKITGLSSCGRATIEALKMNNSTVVNARKRWVSAGWHPPDL
ncbi:HNH endonuclease domain-containing protein [Desulfonema limicola]|uniref:HNH endonuclease domain-containing protein n=1 Tax=Desulfonema limicola TaxID=45656 RepID=A0A975B314_9BACT|nr:HNH endonuclease signature motif containing protein [Desulfonema limicola]QTA77866.1 HNH endonuclease domain-containing protein [Desulfonema limicola]